MGSLPIATKKTEVIVSEMSRNLSDFKNRSKVVYTIFQGG